MTQTFDYRTPAMVNGVMMGTHKSRQRGIGADFYKNNRFLDDPEPRRLDLRVSLSDPFENLYVKSFRQRSKLDVIVFIDVSTSMRYGNKLALIEKVFNSIKASVRMAGDDFRAWLVADELEAISEAESLSSLLQNQTRQRNKANATDKIFASLPSKPALIFFISDFYWQKPQFDSLMTLLSKHWLVPVVVWQSQEYLDFPTWRFVELTDLESGQSGLVFVTPKQKQRLQSQYSLAKQTMTQHFRRFQFRPFWLIDEYQVEDMSRYFVTT